MRVVFIKCFKITGKLNKKKVSGDTTTNGVEKDIFDCCLSKSMRCENFFFGFFTDEKKIR